MELTLIIIFIGLAFALVGLVVRTAEVMSIVVISVGVIVGFVSYRDAFNPQSPIQNEVVSGVTQDLPSSSEAPIREPLQAESEPEPVQEPVQEPLPRLPKIHRLPSTEDERASEQPEPRNEQARPTSFQQVLAADQIKKIRERKPRARKAIQVTRDEEKEQD